MRIKILFIDNNPEYRMEISDLLEGQGHRLLGADSLEEADVLLKKHFFHLIICDLRLKDDDDTLDRSGLEFIRRPEWQHLPQILITAWPTYEALAEAVPHVKAIAEKDDPRKLLETVARVIKQHILPRTPMHFGSPGHYPLDREHLANLIGHETDLQDFAELDEELTFLLYQLFPEYQNIRLGRVFWHRKGRVTFSVFLFDAERQPRARLVLCGLRGLVEESHAQFERYRPTTGGGQMASGRHLAQTTRLAGSSFQALDHPLESLVRLDEYIRFAPNAEITPLLDHLAKQGLGAWHKSFLGRQTREPIEPYYQEKLAQIAAPRDTKERLADNIQHLCGVAPLVAWRLTRHGNQLRFRKGQYLREVRDPRESLEALFAKQTAVPFLNAPGHLSGDNILTNGKAIYLTDFLTAGPAPWTRNYHSLEALFRYDSRKIQEWQVLEEALVSGDFYQPQLAGVESIIEPIKYIRILAKPHLDDNPAAYRVGMFYHAIGRVLEIDPERWLLPSEIERLLHCLFSAALLAERLSNEGRTGKQNGKPAYQIDRKRLVLKTPKKGEIRLSENQISLLEKLLEGDVVSRGDLGRHVWPEKEDAGNTLTQNMKRLRTKLAVDPAIEIVTEPDGYRLVIA